MRSDAIVLVADDDRSVRRSLSRLIRRAGIEVSTFGSAKGLLARTPPDGPACAVFDLVMPDLPGLELQRELKSRGPDIPVIFVSGHGDVPAAVEAMREGAVDFLQKPFDAQELLARIQQALERDRRQRARRAYRDSVRHRAESLTPRESQVLTLVVKGLPNKRIARELGTTEKTIKVHRGRVMEKMQAGSLPDLVRMADALEPRASLPASSRPEVLP